MNTTIDWKSFLNKHDPVWEKLPQEWHEGAFSGNGSIGAMIYKGSAPGDDEKNVLAWEIGRCDVCDHRDEKGIDLAWPFSTSTAAFARGRLPIGRLQVCTIGKVIGGQIRLDLWNGEVSGVIATDKGKITWCSWVQASEDLVVLVFDCEDGEQDFRLTWNPYEAKSPLLTHDVKFTMEKNPDSYTVRKKNISICVQPLLAGGDYATALAEYGQESNRRIGYLTTSYSVPVSGAAESAYELVSKFNESSITDLQSRHRAWWNNYYKKSFVSIPDARLEGFYWIQMYKIASATRSDGHIVDTCGPWLKTDTAWPGIWWNLNVQLTYWPLYTANQLQIAESMIKFLDANFDEMILNTPKEYREDSSFICNPTGSNNMIHRCEDLAKHRQLDPLPWICHNYWMHYKRTMDDSLLEKGLYPLLKRAIQLYLHHLEKDEFGTLHLAKTFSSEYGFAQDATQDLAILRWGCKTLIWICDRLKIEDPKIPVWQDCLDRLSDYHKNENGLMVGKDVPFAKSHRHFSHLFPIYPFYLLNVDDEEVRELVHTSVNHWLGLTGALEGYSFTGACSMMTAIENGNRAYEYLNTFLDRYIHPNTMYTEWGSRCPVIETPLSAARSLQDMLIQCFDDVIKIFPAVPDLWESVTFHDFLAEGAFLISAVRERKKTQWIRIKSLAGEPLRIKTDLELVEIPGKIKTCENGHYEIILSKDNEVFLSTESIDENCISIRPVQSIFNTNNYYGLKKGPLDLKKQ